MKIDWELINAISDIDRCDANWSAIERAEGKSIYIIIQNRPNIQSGEIADKLAIPSPTVKRILFELLQKGLIEKQGKGRNISYRIY